VPSDGFQILWDMSAVDGSEQRDDVEGAGDEEDTDASGAAVSDVDSITRTGSYMLRAQIEDGLYVDIPATVRSI